MSKEHDTMQQAKPTPYLLIYIRATMLGISIICLPVSSTAATFVVNSTADTHDLDLKDGKCLDAFGKCTFRAALEQANYLDDATYSEPHVIDMTQIKNDILLSLGEVPPLIHIELLGNDPEPEEEEVENFVARNYAMNASTTDIVFPNPAVKEMTLDLRRFNSDELTVTIIDTHGYPVEELDLEGFGNVKLDLDLAEYENGTYWVKIKQAKNKAFLKQMVVDHLHY